MRYFTAAYGTSKLDKKLQGAHQILDVSTGLIQGSEIRDEQGVIHFLCDHVAVMPFTDNWVYETFSARLGVFKPEHANDPHRRHLLQRYRQVEPILVESAISAVNHMLATGQPGLPVNRKLR